MAVMGKEADDCLCQTSVIAYAQCGVLNKLPDQACCLLVLNKAGFIFAHVLKSDARGAALNKPWD